jgi:hypothetical protein
MIEMMKPPGYRTKEQPVLTRPEFIQIDTEQVRKLTEAEIAEIGKLFTPQTMANRWSTMALQL